MRRLAIAALALAVPGCGYGLMQTAKTEPPGAVAVSLGMTLVQNEVIDQQGAGSVPAGEARVRVGVAEHVDVGVSAYLAPGVLADVKYAPLDPKGRFAVAPRLGFGYSSTGDDRVAIGIAGGVVSYEVARWMTPYAGLSFANLWIERATPKGIELGPGESLVGRKGYGDGMVQLTAGLELRTKDGFAMLGEVSRWLPAQDDPGDFFKLVPTTLVTIGMVVRGGGQRRTE